MCNCSFLYFKKFIKKSRIVEKSDFLKGPIAKRKSFSKKLTSFKCESGEFEDIRKTKKVTGTEHKVNKNNKQKNTKKCNKIWLK